MDQGDQIHLLNQVVLQVLLHLLTLLDQRVQGGLDLPEVLMDLDLRFHQVDQLVQMDPVDLLDRLYQDLQFHQLDLDYLSIQFHL